jgi:Transglycosylase SLT domain
MKIRMRSIISALIIGAALGASAEAGRAQQRKHHRAPKRSYSSSKKEPGESNNSSEPAVGTQLRLTDGNAFPVDEAWEDSSGIWYRKNGVTQLLEKDRVRAIERAPASNAPQVTDEKTADGRVVDPGAKPRPVWIYLAGGARVEADEATEGDNGVWYRRGGLSVFIDKARVDRVAREATEVAGAASDSAKLGWSSGSPKLDALIKQSGARHGVDPYLVFLVMEEESHFNPHVVSPKGARGLMQLMPGTGARFGVRHPFNAAESVEGGTRYLKQLLQRYNGRVDLALASYNAGEGAVAKFGSRVPPYHETQSYVRRISKRYGRMRVAGSGNQPPRREGGQ